MNSVTSRNAFKNKIKRAYKHTENVPNIEKILLAVLVAQIGLKFRS